jgi:hypothetical protein
MGSNFEYGRTIQTQSVTLPGSGTDAQRRVALSQTRSGKVLVWCPSGIDLFVLGGASAVDANVAPSPDNRAVIKATVGRVIDVGSSSHVSVKTIGAATDATVYVEEIE